MRYRRRISLGKHVKLNVSKSGISTSIKIGDLTINPQRNKVTYNTPIKGLSYETKIHDNKPKTEEEEDWLNAIGVFAFTQIFIYGFFFVWVFLLIISGQL